MEKDISPDAWLVLQQKEVDDASKRLGEDRKSRRRAERKANAPVRTNRGANA